MAQQHALLTRHCNRHVSSILLSSDDLLSQQKRHAMLTLYKSISFASRLAVTFILLSKRQDNMPCSRGTTTLRQSAFGFASSSTFLEPEEMRCPAHMTLKHEIIILARLGIFLVLPGRNKETQVCLLRFH